MYGELHVPSALHIRRSCPCGFNQPRIKNTWGKKLCWYESLQDMVLKKNPYNHNTIITLKKLTIISSYCHISKQYLNYLLPIFPKKLDHWNPSKLGQYIAIGRRVVYASLSLQVSPFLVSPIAFYLWKNLEVPTVRILLMHLCCVGEHPPLPCRFPVLYISRWIRGFDRILGLCVRFIVRRAMAGTLPFVTLASSFLIEKWYLISKQNVSSLRKRLCFR